jgi:hypothetical protein
VTTLQSTRKPSQRSRSTLMWLLYLCDAALLVTSGLAYTVLVVEGAAVVMLTLTAWLQWQRRGGR